MHDPLFPINSWTDAEVSKDQRSQLERELRDRGLLNNVYAIKQILAQEPLMSDPGNMRCAHPPTSQHWHYFPQIPRKPQPSSNSVKIPLLRLAAKLVIDWIYDWNISDDQFPIFREPRWNLRPITFYVPHLISVVLVMQKQK